MADSILRLRVQSEEYDNKLKRASDGIQRYAQKCREVGGTLEVVEKETLDFVKSLGRMETVSKTAKGSLSEMTKAFTDLKMQYKQLTDAEKQSPFGQELNNSLNQLKSRIIETKNDLKGIEGELNGSKFGQFGSVIDTIGHKLGLTTNATELLTSKTALLTGAIGAGAAIVGKAAKEWADYNAELAKQDQITQVTTGLKGDDANNMTDKMRALSDTYKVDFRDAINAANTLMSQFGESGESAIQLIKDGMQGMIKGDGPKLLSMIQQYAPAFRDAGVSASQLVAVIQNSEGGIFTDQNMQAIVMGIKNIRLMTNATSEALTKLGIDGQKMSEQMSNGSMTVFDALKQVAGELKNVDSNSKTAGEVMQTVFGRQGAMAGTNLAKAIDGLNTDLEQTKKQTGEVGDALSDLQTANERLNIAIRDCFEYDGWDQMANDIKSNLITALAAVIEKLAEIRDFFTGENQIKWDIKTKPGVNNVADDPNVDANGNYIRKPNKGGTIKVVRQTATPDPIVKPTKPTKLTGGNKTPKTEEQLNNEEIQKLTQEYIHASEQRQAAIRDEIKVLQERNELIQALKDQAQGKGFDPTKMQQATDLTGRTPWATPEQLIKDADVKLPLKLEIVDTTPLTQLENELKRLQEEQNTIGRNSPELWQQYQQQINATKGKISDFKGEGKKDENDLDKFLGNSSKVVSGLNSVASGLQQMGIKLPEGVQKTLGVIQGLMSVIQGVNTIISVFSTSAETANTVAVTGNTVAMTALTAAVAANTAAMSVNTATNFIPFFAHGGLVHAATGYMVPGNDHADRTLIAASSGELILNRAQQGVIASQLENGNGGGMRVVGEIQGEKIVLVANRFLKRSGQGELVTWK